MLALLLPALIGQVARDVRKDIYPAPPVESRHRLSVDLGSGVKARIVGAGSVRSDGTVVCWDTRGRNDRAMARRFTRVLKERNRFRFVPPGNGHRFVVYVFQGFENRRPGFGASGGSEFAGFFEDGGTIYHSRLLLNSGKAKTLSIFIDKEIGAQVELPFREGARAKIGRGTVEIAKIEDRGSRGVRIYSKAEGEAYASLMYSPLDAQGQNLGMIDHDGRPLPKGSKTDWSKIRNGLGKGTNTLAMRPAEIAVRREYIHSVSLSAPYVRRYELGGVPANPVGI